jgi:UDP-N-acetylglucosamine diphosphorylase / glucose-1-phosphate thymidylyltransferase / UDP-N-acetylgalactosamine diphosphorylase / glucosamine-1-phosphate N-acetyltransferase / galactosamine-1-phosphate N-acetyltransferase
MNAPSLVSGSFVDDFFPFSLTRSLADFRCGILTIREKWNYYLKDNLSFPAGISLPANIIPNEELVQSICDLKAGFAWGKTAMLLQLPDILHYNLSEIKKDFDLITKGRLTAAISSTNKLTGSAIFLEPGAVVEHSYLNASEGPIYIGKDTLVMEGSMIRGPFALGEKSVVKMGAKIYGATSIGPACVIGGEIKNSVIFGFSNKAHDGYLGDSIIGEWCNLGAGSTNSNMKNSGGSVKLWNPIKKTAINAGLKCGLMMGDYSRSAINTSFNTGTVVGPASHVFGNGATPSYLPSFSWGYEQEVYDFERAIQHISKWKKLKGHVLNNEEIKQLKNIFDQQNQVK